MLNVILEFLMGGSFIEVSDWKDLEGKKGFLYGNYYFLFLIIFIFDNVKGRGTLAMTRLSLVLGGLLPLSTRQAMLMEFRTGETKRRASAASKNIFSKKRHETRHQNESSLPVKLERNMFGEQASTEQWKSWANGYARQPSFARQSVFRLFEVFVGCKGCCTCWHIMPT